jgi:hypothetical protein
VIRREDGRGFRYVEWHWDPDRSDHTYLVDNRLWADDVVVEFGRDIFIERPARA